MTYVIIFLMMINGTPTWVEIPAKSMYTGQDQVFYTYKDCRVAGEKAVQRYEPKNVLGVSCKEVGQ